MVEVGPNLAELIKGGFGIILVLGFLWFLARS